MNCNLLFDIYIQRSLFSGGCEIGSVCLIYPFHFFHKANCSPVSRVALHYLLWLSHNGRHFYHHLHILVSFQTEQILIWSQNPKRIYLCFTCKTWKMIQILTYLKLNDVKC